MGCGKMGKYVCDKCQVGLYEEEQICPGCCRNSLYGKRHEYCKNKGNLDGLICLWAYEGIAEKIIKNVKYKGEFDMLKELVVMGEQLELEKFVEKRPIVVPVPLYKNRERERGFNQAELVVKSLASRHSLSFNSHLLARTRDTGQQVGKSREVRLKNVEGAFGIAPLHPPLNLRGGPERVILVDDVWTTGATMQECAKVLKKAGVKEIWGLVLAR